MDYPNQNLSEDIANRLKIENIIDTMECCENPSHICKFPVELLFEIFKRVSAKDLIRCRQVSKRWKEVVDAWSVKDDLWKKYCISDHEELSQIVKKKCSILATWYNTYRCLTLWDRTSTATENITEFCESIASGDEIRDCYILGNGVLVVIHRNYVSFYDAYTLQKTARESITGEFIKFIEGDVELVTHNVHMHLSVIRKPYNAVSTFKFPRRQDRRYQNIKLFVIVNRDLYFVDVANILYRMNLVNRKVDELERPTEDSIVVLSDCYGVLHYMTLDRRVYAYYDHEFVQVCILDDEADIFDCIFRYNLFEQMEWYTFYLWAIQMRAQIPPGPMQHINVMKRYGNVVFIGTNKGVVLIFNRPYTRGSLDLFNHEPVKEYDFSEKREIPGLSQDPIVAIEVLEIQNGHRIMVAMPKRIYIITLKHSFEMDSRDMVMLPLCNLAI